MLFCIVLIVNISIYTLELICAVNLKVYCARFQSIIILTVFLTFALILFVFFCTSLFLHTLLLVILGILGHSVLSFLHLHFVQRVKSH